MKVKKYILKILFFVFFTGTLISSAQKILIGDVMPDFDLLNQYSTSIESDSLKIRKGVVLFFYSNKESFKKNKSPYEFNNRRKLFKDLNVKIIGVVEDAIPNIREFSVKEKIRYSIISDNRRILHDIFGITQKQLNSGSRVYSIVFKNGKIVKIITPKEPAENHVYDALGLFLSNN